MHHTSKIFPSTWRVWGCLSSEPGCDLRTGTLWRTSGKECIGKASSPSTDGAMSAINVRMNGQVGGPSAATRRNELRLGGTRAWGCTVQTVCALGANASCLQAVDTLTLVQ